MRYLQSRVMGCSQTTTLTVRQRMSGMDCATARTGAACPTGAISMTAFSPVGLQKRTVRLCLELLLLALLVEVKRACCAHAYGCISPGWDDPLPLATGACRCDAHEKDSRPCMRRAANAW